jgi:hypothetical protein
MKDRPGASAYARYVAIAARLYVDEKKSQREIAASIGFSQSIVGRWLRRYGVEMRPPLARFGAENGRYKDGSESRAYRQLLPIERCAWCGERTQLVVHHNHEGHVP